ncbi:hypothetical protein J4475_01210 [Candidatus Woesearchaeota archaeon]|nr:hypothetical protein [Candidatus Woesearchaeota archaeon]OGV93001.1 MAG: hypothetical protein A3B57_00750 [Microgenomates group bacterium RIFCSPLOWO2_01_FULL_47_10]
MKKIKYGAFCELYGKSLRNRALEYVLELNRLDFAVGDLAREIGISRPKAYQIIGELEKEELVRKSRIVGGTQLYVLNETDGRVKILRKAFRECLKSVMEYHEAGKIALSA